MANPGVPVVSATLVVKAGADANPAERPGLAGFTAAMLQEGTTNRSALQLADDVASLGAALDVARHRRRLARVHHLAEGAASRPPWTSCRTWC